MPLAQRLESATSAASSLPLTREQGRATEPGLDKDNISLLRRVSVESRGRVALPAPGAPDAGKPSPDALEAKRASESRSHSIAINLIDEVSSIIPMLVEENETLRTVLKRDRERLEADVERATLVACEWRKSAEAAKQQVEALSRNLLEVTERLERSEAKLQSEKELSSKSARDAAEAECLSSLFEEKLLSSFGAGSAFQATLDRIRQRADTDLA